MNLPNLQIHNTSKLQIILDNSLNLSAPKFTKNGRKLLRPFGSLYTTNKAFTRLVPTNHERI